MCTLPIENHAVRVVTANTGIITTVAGTGTPVYSGDGAATAARFHLPYGVAIDTSGNVNIADWNHAGTWRFGYSGDGGAATSAQLHTPSGIAIDTSSNVRIADTDNHRIRLVALFATSISPSAGPTDTTIATPSVTPTAKPSVTPTARPSVTPTDMAHAVQSIAVKFKKLFATITMYTLTHSLHPISLDDLHTRQVDPVHRVAFIFPY